MTLTPVLPYSRIGMSPDFTLGGAARAPVMLTPAKAPPTNALRLIPLTSRSDRRLSYRTFQLAPSPPQRNFGCNYKRSNSKAGATGAAFTSYALPMQLFSVLPLIAQTEKNVSFKNEIAPVLA